MKKLLLCVMIGMLCIFTLAAGGQGGRAQTSEISIATHFAADTTEFRAVERFKDTVERGSGGRLTIATFPGSSLGTEMDNLEQVKTNQVTMSVFGDLLTSQLAPEFDPTVVPFIFPSNADVYEMFSGQLGDRIRNAIEERGNQILMGLQKRGARYLTASREIRTPADLTGLKLRVPEIPTWVAVWGGLGALPTPVAFAETYNALQTRVVDAQENPISNIWVAKFYEVNRYIIMTEHLFGVYKWTINRDYFRALPDDLRTLVWDAVQEACAWGDAQVDSRERELFTELRSVGAVFIDVDKQQFINAARPHVERLAATWDPMARDFIRRYYR